ncbi:uncharacterized protein HMPREF1541_01946 [Cyphellophora europaea CBS 101466]|uniref:NmrA-like domain-containing protein n=1 Tax=Cyphellophora europaea (strain CBS 101466) TaxID=1220924 RepID=W2S409_CYPE1|nr:uncharacterized protein HMPREF1541_01946 [Cyphellophora europaea CBS 101466]ETN42788.1 hypothetical protein HMPREF1541_01946 [Cyphellophora europaea CBS 101466]
MAPSIRRVAVAGINGTLGPAVVRHLIDGGFELTILTRDRTKTLDSWAYKAEPSVVEVDYSSVEKLASAFQGHDAVVSLISRLDADSSNAIADAAANAGVYRLVPSCFGVNHRLLDIQEFPVLAPKVIVEQHVEKLAAEGKITFTGIQTGILFDWALKKGISVNAAGTTTVFNGGDFPLSATLLDDAGKAVAAVLKNPAESENKYFFIQSASITQNKLLHIFKEVRPDLELKRTEVDTKALYDKSMEAYKQGARSPDALRGMLVHASSGPGMGQFKNTDNAAVGIVELTEEQLREVAREAIDEVTKKQDFKPLPV